MSDLRRDIKIFARGTAAYGYGSPNGNQGKLDKKVCKC